MVADLKSESNAPTGRKTPANGRISPADCRQRSCAGTAADHESNAPERDLLRGAIRALTDGALRSRALDALLARFQAGLEVQGRDARLAQVTGQLAADREDAEAAFTLAAVMVIADDARNEAEDALLTETRDLLGISAKRAATLLGEVRRSAS
jgi:uncharacterized tellurite resistance protein B-like protein